MKYETKASAEDALDRVMQLSGFSRDHRGLIDSGVRLEVMALTLGGYAFVVTTDDVLPAHCGPAMARLGSALATESAHYEMKRVGESSARAAVRAAVGLLPTSAGEGVREALSVARRIIEDFEKQTRGIPRRSWPAWCQSTEDPGAPWPSP